MDTVKILLRQKGHDVVSVSPDASAFEAIRLMADKGVGALPVVEEGRLKGMVSERDCARKVMLQGLSPKGTTVHDIMTTKIVVADPEKTVEECMALMTAKRVRHLPIMENGSLTGIISIGDLVKSIIAHQQFVIEQLEKYIYGYQS